MNYKNIMERLDKCNLEENEEYIKVSEDNETLLFSDKIIKINKYSFSQKRIMAITNQKLYNFKYK